MTRPKKNFSVAKGRIYNRFFMFFCFFYPFLFSYPFGLRSWYGVCRFRTLERIFSIGERSRFCNEVSDKDSRMQAQRRYIKMGQRGSSLSSAGLLSLSWRCPSLSATRRRARASVRDRTCQTHWQVRCGLERSGRQDHP